MSSFFILLDYKLELLEVADWEPYNKKLTFSLTFKFKKHESTLSRFSKSYNLCAE